MHVKRGDMETAQKMVDEEAEKAAYTVKAYHGTPDGGFNSFDYSKLEAARELVEIG